MSLEIKDIFCPICYCEYNFYEDKLRKPQIYVNCGHTICLMCVNHL